MPYRCLQCGGSFPNDRTCREQFDLGQIKELEQLGYGAVHHLSVPCYMLQHNVYSRRGWIEVRNLLAKFIEDGWTPAMARRNFAAGGVGEKRNWSLTKGPKLAGVEDIVWSRTVASVRLDNADHYCADVNVWARNMLADTAALARSFDKAALI